MTRKDYIMLADFLAEVDTTFEQREELCRKLKADNPRFNKEKFYEQVMAERNRRKGSVSYTP